MKARDIMTTKLVTVKASTTVGEIARLLVTHRISAVPVVDDEQRLLGIVSEDDLVLMARRMPFSIEQMPALFGQWVDPELLEQNYAHARRLTAADAMTTRVACMDADAEIGDVAWYMARRRLPRVVVISDGRPIGIITRADLVRLLVES